MTSTTRLSKGPMIPVRTDAQDGEVYGLPYKDARRTVLEAFELRYVTHLLAAAGGNVAAAARQARMDPTYPIKLVQRHGLRAR